MIDTHILWQNLVDGNKNALSQLFLLFYDDLFRYGLKISKEKELVEDAIQDLFLKLWKNHANLHPVEDLKAYFYRSLRNHIIDSLEQKKPQTAIDNDFEHPFDIAFSPEDFLINKQVTIETQDNIIRALNSLLPRQREAIYLRYFEELDFPAMAIIMNINVQSVRNNLHRGLVALRNHAF